MITRIERWNGGTLRRYRHHSGALLCVHHETGSRDKAVKAIPAWSAHVSCPIDRAEAGRMLREWRRDPQRAAA